tara:strand:- start:2286 stop:4220 length:1935 start_codon:yes stop_codon:yes gene_type:complete
MPSEQASKFPNKPWGTAITAIGLAKQDSKRYEGYTLVDIEPLKGSSDLYWVFEKLDGAVWETRGKARQSVVPEKFRDSTETTRTIQDVDPGTLPSTIEGNLLSSVVEEQPNSGKAVKTEITESINEDADALTGSEYGAIVGKDTTESLVGEGSDADTGIDILSSRVVPLGNGKAIKTTHRVDGSSWPSTVDDRKEISKTDVPARFKGESSVTVTSKMVGSAPSLALGANEIQKSYEKETPDRYKETTVMQTAPNITLEGAQVVTQFGGVKATTSEEIVAKATAATTGHTIISSTVQPVNDTESIKRTVTAAETYPTLSGEEYDPHLGIQLPFTQQVVNSSGATAVAGGSLVPIDQWRTLKKTKDIAALQNYLKALNQSYPSMVTMHLPDILLSATFREYKSLSDGQGQGAGTSWSWKTNSSISVSGAFEYEIEKGYKGPVAATVHVFYVDSEELGNVDILARTESKAYPIVRPKSHIMSAVGTTQSRSFSESGSKNGYAISEGGNTSPSITREIIPPTLHGSITVDAPSAVVSQPPTTKLDAYFDKSIEKRKKQLGELRDTLDPADPAYLYYNQAIDNMVASEIVSSDYEPGEYSTAWGPKNLEATVPPSISADDYLISSDIKHYGYGLSRITAVVANLTSEYV